MQMRAVQSHCPGPLENSFEQLPKFFTNQTCQVWDASNGRTLMVYRGQKEVIEGVNWSPIGTWVASASADRTVHVWTPFTGQLIAFYSKYASNVETVHWSADGTRLSIGTDEGGVEIWPGQY